MIVDTVIFLLEDLLESDREGMRVVIELKREANPAQLLAELYQKTPLQMNFGATLLGIVNGEPRQLSLKGLLQEFLRFREETLTRCYRYELDKAQSRLEIVGGLFSPYRDWETDRKSTRLNSSH